MTRTIHDSLNERAQAGAMDDSTDPDPEVPERARGPRRYSARYKAQILDEYERLDKAAKGALLRREGLYTSLISEWRKQRDRGALEALAKPAGRRPADPRDREVARLRRENERLAAIGDRLDALRPPPGRLQRDASHRLPPTLASSNLPL
jgi:transposase